MVTTLLLLYLIQFSSETIFTLPMSLPIGRVTFNNIHCLLWFHQDHCHATELKLYPTQGLNVSDVDAVIQQVEENNLTLEDVNFNNIKVIHLVQSTN